MLGRRCIAGLPKACMSIPRLTHPVPSYQPWQRSTEGCSFTDSLCYSRYSQWQHRCTVAARSASAGSASSDEESASNTAGSHDDGDDQLASMDSSSDPSAIVRLQVVKDVPRHDMPLLLGSVRTITRTGFAVTYQGQDYLLTAASAVVHATQIRVYVGGRDKPFKARVTAIAAEADLAVLSIIGDTTTSSSSSISTSTRVGAAPARGGPKRRRVQGGKAATGRPSTIGAKSKGGSDSSTQQGSAEEEEFWSCMAPLELAPAPPDPQDRVTVQTLPAGQPAPKSMSGQVLSVGLQVYPGAMMRLLGLQVACSGSREAVGAPVVDAQGACVGAVFQRVKARMSVTGRGRKGRMESMVHAAPVPVIEHVLHDIHTTGTYQGFPQLGIRFARLESPALRQYLGMQRHHEGILLADVGALSPCANILHPGDVILEVGGRQVSNDGTVEFRPPERVSLTYHVAQLSVGHPLQVKVLRQGQEQTLTVPLSTPPRLLQPPYKAGPPSFLLLGGLVLTPVTVPYLDLTYGRDWPHKAPAAVRDLLSQWPKQPGEEPVVIAAVVQEGRAVEGYKPRLLEGKRILRFRVGPEAGGPAHKGPPMEEVHSLRQLTAAILACKEGEVRLELHGGAVVVLSLDDALEEANRLVMDLYQLQHPLSADLVDLVPAEEPVGKGKERVRRRELAAAGRGVG